MTEMEQEERAALEARLKALVEHYAIERGEMAEQLSQLLEENDQLKRKVQHLEQAIEGVDNPKAVDKAQAMSFDFSLPADKK